MQAREAIVQLAQDIQMVAIFGCAMVMDIMFTIIASIKELTTLFS